MSGSIDWGDAAGWAQAVATAVALGLALRQGYLSGRRDKARDRAAATAAYTLVNNASQTIIHLHDDLLGSPGGYKTLTAQRILSSGRLSELAAALNGFDATRLPQEVFVTCLSVAQTSVREFVQAVENIATPPAAPLLARDPWPAVDNIQKAASMMVAPLVLMAPDARWRALKERAVALWRSSFGRSGSRGA